ncbi:SANT associated-domain-containing protein [Umbelopsis sp. AD052]|nr:SANT associated-domain-containing protein [Umbelopsis sp. AD052]
MSHASTDTQQQKKVSDKSGDQPIDSINSNSNSTESSFKLPLEHSKPNILPPNLNRIQNSQKSSNNIGPSLLHRWLEISSEDSYSSRPPDCFSTEVSDSSDTTMTSNLRAEMNKSQQSANTSSTSSVPSLPQASPSSIDPAMTKNIPKDNQHLNSKTRIPTLMPAPELLSSHSTEPTDSISSVQSPSTDLGRHIQSTRETPYQSVRNSSESNISSIASDTRSEQYQSTASKYTQPRSLPSIPEIGSAARATSRVPSEPATRGDLRDAGNYSRKRSHHESMLHARNQRIARFRADYTARKGEHRFASSHYSSNSSLTVSGSNTSDASDHNNENEVHLSNWKLKRIKVGEALAIVIGGIHCTLDKPWHSTRIVSRIDERTLVSSSGKIYRLFGEIDIEGMLLNEFPLELCHQFQDGFPANWGQIILPHILPQASAELPSFMQNSSTSQAAPSVLSSATLSTGTDYDYPTELTRSARSKVENEPASPMSWRNPSSLSSSPHSIPMRSLVTVAATAAAQHGACESDSCPGDYSNVSDTTYQTDGSKREASTSVAGVQTFVPQTARNMDEPFSQFSVHHIQANSVNYPHTPWGITYKTLKRRQDEANDVYFQLPARKRVISGDTAGSDTAMIDFASNSEKGGPSTQPSVVQNDAATSLAPADTFSDVDLPETDKEGRSTIGDGGTKFGVG